MKLKLGNATVEISRVFSGTNQYQIPFYQRRYVWDNANWGPLWEDIIQFPDKHFAGTIITYEQATNFIEIVDGQQRLTTFQIIFCVIRDLLDLEESNDGAIERKKSEIIRYITVQDVRDEPPRIVLTKRDNPAFMEVFSGDLWETLNIQNIEGCLNAFEPLQNSELHPIIVAYGFFGSKIITYLDRCEDSDEKFKNLQKLADILKNFRVIEAELDSESGYDPEEIFQIINDTGRMLDDFDYLRNYLFLRTRKYLGNERIGELDKLYHDHWDEFEDWDSEKLKLFFRAFLMGKLGPTCFEGEDKDIHPFDCYRKHIKTIEGQDQDLNPLLQLSYYADSYKKLNSPTSISKVSDLKKLGNRMRFYDDLKLPRLDWFLLFMRHTFELSDECLNKLCDMLESYIVREGFCNGNCEDSYKSIKTFCSKYLNMKFTLRQFVNDLSKKWPDSSEVEKVLKERADEVDPNLVLYILRRIEHPDEPFTNTQIKKLVRTSNSFSELYKDNLDKGWEDFLPDMEELLHQTNNVVGSIGEIASRTARPEDDWNMERIIKRTTTLLDCFNDIWKPITILKHGF